MAGATSPTTLVNGFTSPFLSGGKKTCEALFSFATYNSKIGGSTRRLVVVAAAASPKKSWIPAVRGGGNFIDPEWLDGS